MAALGVDSAACNSALKAVRCRPTAVGGGPVITHTRAHTRTHAHTLRFPMAYTCVSAWSVSAV